jgi:NAD(P)-dependent dehydrogenase (short-subunit alcohol dehydrogenase family)
MRHTRDMGRLSGEVALVTGSTSGIGRAIALRFAQEGASLIVTGRDRERGEAVVRGCEGRARFVAADLLDPATPGALVDAAVAEFGALTVLVNNASGGRPDGPAAQLADEQWRAVLEVDLLAAARLCRAALPSLRACGHGSIINLSSRAASRASRGIAGYISAKGALEALTRSIAVDEASHGVRCNAISPGYVLNDRRDARITQAERARREAMHLLGLGTADDVAFAAVYLASRESRWLTGAVLPLDGGSSVARAGSFS